MTEFFVPPEKYRRAKRRHTTWVKARRAQRVHHQMLHPMGAVDCVCEHSVWYFAKRKSIGHNHHCEMCHPRYRNSSTRSRVQRFMVRTGLCPTNRQVKALYE